MTELKTIKDLEENPINRLVFEKQYYNKQTVVKDEK